MTVPKEKPILAKGPMVRGVLNGSKTQTRRVMRTQPIRVSSDRDWDAEPGEVVIYRGWPHRLAASRGRNKRDAGELTPIKIHSPYKVGQILWVRETWGTDFVRGQGVGIIYKEPWPDGCIGMNIDLPEGIIPPKHKPGRWRSSIFMPRWASRIDLEVTEVRAQDLQDISLDDCLAEGVGDLIAGPGHYDPQEPGPEPDSLFAHLWDSINSKPKPVMVKKKIVSYVSYPWEAVRETRAHRGLPWKVVGNPAVFAYTFRRVRP